MQQVKPKDIDSDSYEPFLRAQEEPQQSAYINICVHNFFQNYIYTHINTYTNTHTATFPSPEYDIFYILTAID
jgi:hypothetical protein